MSIYNHQVTDLTPLSDLPWLSRLYLKLCGVTDIPALAGLERLDVLASDQPA